MAPQAAAALVGVDAGGPDPGDRNPLGQAIGVTLLTDGVPEVIAPREDQRAAQRLEVDPPPAARAVVDQQPRMLAPQRVPQVVKAGHVADFAHALPVNGLVVAPVPERIHVEVVPVDVDPHVPDHPAQLAFQPGKGRGMAKVQQVKAVRDLVAEPGRHVRRGLEEPLRVLPVKPRVAHHPLRLDPQQEPQPGGVGCVGDGLQAAGIAGRVGFPIADGPGPPARTWRTREPAGIDPPGIDWRAVSGDVFDHADHVCLGRGLEADDRVRRGGDRRLDRRAAHGRGVMGQQQAPQQILAPPPIRSGPEEGQDGGGADLLARTQPEVRDLHARLDAHARPGHAAERRRPLAGPPDAQDHAAGPGRGEVHQRHRAVGRSTAEGREPEALARSQRLLQRLEIGDLLVASFCIMEMEAGPVVGRPELRVQGLHLLEDRSVGGPRVLEIQDPFQGGEIVVGRGHAAHGQPGGGVGQCERSLRTRAGRHPHRFRGFPGGEQPVRRPSAVAEREWEAADGPGIEMRRGPSRGGVHLGRRRPRGPRRRGPETDEKRNDKQTFHSSIIPPLSSQARGRGQVALSMGAFARRDGAAA